MYHVIAVRKDRAVGSCTHFDRKLGGLKWSAALLLEKPRAGPLALIPERWAYRREVGSHLSIREVLGLGQDPVSARQQE